MKKIAKLFSLVLVFFLVFAFTGCSKEATKFEDGEYSLAVESILDTDSLLLQKEGKVLVGVYDQENGVLYLDGARLEANKAYSYVYLDKDLVEVTEEVSIGEFNVPYVKITKSYSFPTVNVDGKSFAGWYITSDYVNGTKVKNTSDLANKEILEKAGIDTENGEVVTAIYLRNITLGEAGIISVVCVLIVFAMLALLCVIVSLFKYIAPKEKEQVAAPKAAPVVALPQRAFTMDDIKDEDMMAAALVATIDYHNETGEDVRVVSVKQIG